ncbi:MAG TPA: peptide-methionine (R)-S-oxide reductase MsrB [Candidatus Paceibacterota bacterium]
MTDEDWKQKLTPEQYRVLRERGTEPAFTGKYVNEHGKGMFVCAGCGSQLFSSEAKFDSGTGWPSFDQALPGSVVLVPDDSHGMTRVEVTCAKCGGHLGHVFDDGPADPSTGSGQGTGKRFCINSCALDLKKEGE